ncbi:MAG: glutamate-1-semialdehyde 2,1-aminomutase [Bacteriovorax sp.]|nr:glutamate-1-semialdehyde 2,1-aminomutase [Bacteriovorax sp.]
METKNIKLDKNIEMAKKAQALIPGGAHTYSKGDDQFPANAPRIIDRGEGAHIYDVDGNKWLDLGMSLGTVILGHAYGPVIEAAQKELSRGCNFVRPSYLEGELAELMNSIIPSAEMVKFGKNGSDAVTAAVKLARAYTGRDYVVRCASDPFNSIHDWFIGSTVMNRGVPEAISNLTLKFEYNNLDSAKALFDQYPGKIACFIFEPIAATEPAPGFLQGLKDLCEKNGSLLIFDEVVSGFRFHIGGAQVIAGVTPHLSAFGKAMANGFSVSALVGQKEFMKLGGLGHDQERVFLLSTTHGGETHSLAASIATIKEIQNKNAIEHFYTTGRLLQEGMRKAAQDSGAAHLVDIIGYGCKPGFSFRNGQGEISAPARTLFMQELCARGILMPYVVPSLAHQQEHLNYAVEAFKDACGVLKKATEEGFEKYLIGDAVKPVFRKFN